MKSVAILLLSLTAIALAQEKEKSWSWNFDSEAVETQPQDEIFIADETSYTPQQEVKNSTQVEQIVDNILVSGRQGRNVEGFDELYNDPNVMKAFESGNDGESRNIIKERLCSLGLMQCEGKAYVSPEDLIYAQPVNIQPVGQPIASIPVRGPPRAYGSQKPFPIGPPPRKGYNGPFRPPPNKFGPPSTIYGSSYNNYASSSNSFSGSSGPNSFSGSSGPNSFSGSSGPNSFSGSSGSYLTKPPGFNSFDSSSGPYLSKPPGPIYEESEPFEFERPKPPFIKENKQGFIGAASSLTGEITQQHIHHHYHHGEDKNKPTVIVQPSIPLHGAETHLHSSSSNYNSGGFSPVNSGIASSGLYNNVKPVYENSPSYPNNAYKGSSQTSQSGVYNLGYAPGNNYNAPGSNYNAALNNYNSQSTSGLGSFGNNQYYKKELNTAAASSNVLGSGSGSYYGTNQYGNQFGYNGAETGRADDCVCVPFDQCPNQDVIGRKDDLFLPIDPRNINKNIDAIPDEKVVITDGNGTMTIVRVPKDTRTNATEAAKKIAKRETNDKASDSANKSNISPRQAFYGNSIQQCGPRQVCCRRPYKPQVAAQNRGQCGTRHSQGINGRIKNPAYVDGDSEFGEYPWQVAILKKDPKESVYVCGGTLIDQLHIITAAHCVKTYTGFDLRVRLGEWDVNHDVEFFPYIERDIVSVHVHPQYYAGTLDNDMAILKMDHPVEWTKYPHISPACLPDKFTDYTGARCWTTGWGKDAFGDFGKYQNILKEVDVPIIGHQQCEAQLKQTRLGYQYQLNPGFICAGGEEGKDACKGDGGGPMVCERGGTWQLVGVVSWGIGCGQVNVPGVYVKVAHYLDWIAQITGRF